MSFKERTTADRLRRYCVVIKVELRGQEEIPEVEKRYSTAAFHEGFTNREEAVSFARRTAESTFGYTGSRKYKVVLYTLEVADVEHISKEALFDVGEKLKIEQGV